MIQLTEEQFQNIREILMEAEKAANPSLPTVTDLIKAARSVLENGDKPPVTQPIIGDPNSEADEIG